MKDFSVLHNLKNKNIDLSKKNIAVVVSEYHKDITDSIYQAAYDTLIKAGISSKNIIKKNVPGAFELPLGAQNMAENKKIDAVVCIGCVIQGNTKHFDFICQSVAFGLTNITLQYKKPIIFGVLTPHTYKQALERSGGKYGNKGVEAATAVIKMIENFSVEKQGG